MGKALKKSKRIVVDPISEGLYEVHLKNENYKINRVIKILLLRRDFFEFLQNLERSGLEKKERTFISGKVNIWGISREAFSIIREYLESLLKSEYFNDFLEHEKQSFFDIAYSELVYTYGDALANKKNPGNLKDLVFYNNTHNSPGISRNFFFKDSFLKDCFGNAVRDDKTHVSKRFYGSSETVKQLMTAEDLKEKVCQIVIDSSVGKEEFIKYIKSHWDEIACVLNNGYKKPSRTGVAVNLMRDIEIYNKYQEFKEQDLKFLDRKVRDWFRLEKGQELEPNTIRKIVSDLESDIKNINCEK